MAITLSNVYGSDATTPNAEYPGGTFKNDTGHNDGTPLEHTWAKDKDGFFQAITKNVGLPISNAPDTSIVSQYQQALDYRYIHSTPNPRNTILDICGEKYYDTHDWVQPDAFPNITTTTGTIWDSCVGVDYDTNLPCIFLIVDGTTIRKITGPWVYDASPQIGSSLSLDFGETPATINAICCDGARLYVLWRSVSTGYHVSSFSLNTWNRYLHVALGVDFDSLPQYSKIILASNTHLAVSLDNVSGSPGVAIVNKSTGVFYLGNGTGTPSGDPPFSGCGRMTTDGDHVFWIHIEDGGAPYTPFLCSAKISDPTTSDYSLKEGYGALTLKDISTGVYNYGSESGSVVLASASGKFYTFSKTDDDLTASVQISNIDPYEVGTSYRTVIGCDGMNLWTVVHQKYKAKNTDRMDFAKLPIIIFSRAHRSSNLTSYDDFNAHFVMTRLEGKDVSTYEPGRLLFDGRDMWFISRTGFVSRICNPGIR